MEALRESTWRATLSNSEGNIMDTIDWSIEEEEEFIRLSTKKAKAEEEHRDSLRKRKFNAALTFVQEAVLEGRVDSVYLDTEESDDSLVFRTPRRPVTTVEVTFRLHNRL